MSEGVMVGLFVAAAAVLALPLTYLGTVIVDWFGERRASLHRKLLDEVKENHETIKALQEKLVELAADLDDSEEARVELNKRLEEVRLKLSCLKYDQENYVRRRPFAPAEAGVVVTTPGCQKVECPFPKPCPMMATSTHHVTCGNCGHRQRIREHRNEN